MPRRPPWLRAELPGYVFDLRMRGGRWREVLPDGRLGQLVSRKDIIEQMRRVADATADRMAGLAEDAVRGFISPEVFRRAMVEELRNVYNAATALGKGGWRMVTPADFGRNGMILREEYRRLARFASDIAEGRLSEAQAKVRARLYAGKAYSRFWEEESRRARRAHRKERWVTVGDEAVCSDCQALEAMGWVDAGMLPTVPGAGATQCLGNCRCEVIYGD